MKCNVCGRESGGAFCPYCGARMELRPQKCPVCGHQSLPGERFCSACGVKLNAAADMDEASAEPFGELSAASSGKSSGTNAENKTAFPHAFNEATQLGGGANGGAESDSVQTPAGVQEIGDRTDAATAHTACGNVNPQTAHADTAANAAHGAIYAVSPPQPAKMPQPSPLIYNYAPFYFNTLFASLMITWLCMFIGTIIIRTRATITDMGCYFAAFVVSQLVAIGVTYLIYRKFRWGYNSYKSYMKGLNKSPGLANKTISAAWYKLLWVVPLIMALAAVVIGVLFYKLNGSVILALTNALSLLVIVVGLTIYYAVQIRRGGMDKRIKLACFGKEKINFTDRSTVTYGMVGEELKRYQEEWDNYLLYNARRKAYERGAVFTSDSAARLLAVKNYLPRIGCIAVIVVCALAAALAGYNTISNIFREDKISAVKLGMTAAQVEKYIGALYETTDAGDYVYYSANYARLLDKNKNFNPDDIENMEDFEQAFSEALKLEEQLNSTSFGYITVSFEVNEGGEKVVDGIFFDPSRLREDISVSGAEARVLTCTRTDGVAEISVRIDYSDNSFFLGNVTAEVAGEEDGTLMLRWWDINSHSYVEAECIAE